jgi:predicted P-loop ATPase
MTFGLFERDGRGRLHKSLPNLELALAKLTVKLRFNAFTREHLISTEENRSERPLEDEEVDDLGYAIESRFGLLFGKDFLFDMILATAEENKFHPVRDYLAGLMWDDVPRIDRWLTTYLGVEETEYSNEVGLRWMLGAVERIRNPGCKFDEMLILEGGQGVGKSSALAALAVQEEWFTDTVSMSHGEGKFIKSISGKWIVQSPDLEGRDLRFLLRLKSILSRSSDRARMPYSRFVKDFPRECVMVSCTMGQKYLRDKTGNRRFWPVKVGRIDLDKLRADVDQLWAEAAHRQAAGESCRMRPEMYAAAESEQASRVIGRMTMGKRS